MFGILNIADNAAMTKKARAKKIVRFPEKVVTNQ